MTSGYYDQMSLWPAPSGHLKWKKSHPLWPLLHNVLIVQLIIHVVDQKLLFNFKTFMISNYATYYLLKRKHFKIIQLSWMHFWIEYFFESFKNHCASFNKYCLLKKIQPYRIVFFNCVCSSKRFAKSKNSSLYCDLKHKLKVFEKIYRVCHGFRLTKQDDYFWVNVDLIEIVTHFLS